MRHGSAPRVRGPALNDLLAKDYVFVLRTLGTEVAWRLDLLEGGAVINDTAGMLDLVLPRAFFDTVLIDQETVSAPRYGKSCVCCMNASFA